MFFLPPSPVWNTNTRNSAAASARRQPKKIFTSPVVRTGSRIAGRAKPFSLTSRHSAIHANTRRTPNTANSAALRNAARIPASEAPGFFIPHTAKIAASATRPTADRIASAGRISEKNFFIYSTFR